jgi:hypothetical protein
MGIGRFVPGLGIQALRAVADETAVSAVQESGSGTNAKCFHVRFRAGVRRAVLARRRFLQRLALLRSHSRRRRRLAAEVQVRVKPRQPFSVHSKMVGSCTDGLMQTRDDCSYERADQSDEPSIAYWRDHSEIACSTTVLRQPFIQPDDVKRRFAGQRAAAVLNCAAQADIVGTSALCRVVR